MIAYAKGFMKEIGFGKEATDSLLCDLEKVYNCEESKGIFESYIKQHNQSPKLDYGQMMRDMSVVAECANIHVYSAKLLIYVCLSRSLREHYAKQGISDKIWFDSMCDLKWKLWECEAVKGIHGSFVAEWFYRFFDMTRFALGRLQFEIELIKDTGTVFGKPLIPGYKAIFVHIPRTLTPLTKESRVASYRQAADLFRNEFGEQEVLFACHSWLLSAEMPSLFKDGSNMQSFYKDFDIIKHEYCNKGEYPDAWRLFDMDYTGNIDDYPEDSSFRRTYKNYLKNGGGMGYGFGLFYESDIKGE